MSAGIWRTLAQWAHDLRLYPLIAMIRSPLLALVTLASVLAACDADLPGEPAPVRPRAVTYLATAQRVPCSQGTSDTIYCSSKLPTEVRRSVYRGQHVLGAWYLYSGTLVVHGDQATLITESGYAESYTHALRDTARRYPDRHILGGTFTITGSRAELRFSDSTAIVSGTVSGDSITFEDLPVRLLYQTSTGLVPSFERPDIVFKR